MNLRTILKRFSVEQLRAAIKLHKSSAKRDKLEAEAESLRKALAKVEKKLAALDGNGAATTASRSGRKQGRRKGYKMSAATRNRMRIAALKRYGKLKDEAPATAKRKRKPFSAETRAKMRASQQARWAKARQAKAEPKAEAKA